MNITLEEGEVNVNQKVHERRLLEMISLPYDEDLIMDTNLWIIELG